jgi:hypothetical protein
MQYLYTRPLPGLGTPLLSVPYCAAIRRRQPTHVRARRLARAAYCWCCYYVLAYIRQGTVPDDFIVASPLVVAVRL